MKKLILASILVMIMAVPAFAQVTFDNSKSQSAGSFNLGTQTIAAPENNNQIGIDNSFSNSFSPTNTNMIGNGIGNFSPSASARVDNDIRNSNSNWNSNAQIQGQNNGQVISPSQSVSFSSPVQLPGVNTPGLSELNYRDGKTKVDTDNPLWSFDTTLPKFDPRKYKIVGQEDECANEPIKRFIGKAADLLAKYKGIKGLAYIITTSEAGKTLQGGVNLNGMGTGVGVTGNGGGGGGGLLGFQGGVSKSWDLYTIIILKVVPVA